ncbi:MAG: hypothetical protein ACREHG_05205, partial [Candidatus Saccharimonadales bacterium]
AGTHSENHPELVRYTAARAALPLNIGRKLSPKLWLLTPLRGPDLLTPGRFDHIKKEGAKPPITSSPPATEAPTTTTPPTTSSPPPPPAVPAPPSPAVEQGTDSTNAFTPDWWRCVITPESSGNFDDTSGGFGILVQTWHEYGMSGVPGDYSPQIQASVALRIYHDNGGFGPSAWNNTAHCGKDG